MKLIKNHSQLEIDLLVQLVVCSTTLQAFRKVHAYPIDPFKPLYGLIENINENVKIYVKQAKKDCPNFMLLVNNAIRTGVL